MMTGLLLFGITTSFSINQTKIIFEPNKITSQVFQGGGRIIEVQFFSNKSIANIDLSIVSEIKDFVHASPTHFDAIEANAPKQIFIEIRIPQDAPLGEYGGTLHLQSGNRTIANPLPLSFNVISASSIEEEVSAFLLNEFGTLTPDMPDGYKLAEFGLSPAIIEHLRVGTDLPAILRSGSLIFVGTLIPDRLLTEANVELLAALNIEGVRIDDLTSVISTNRWHRDNFSPSIIPNGSDGIMLSPPGVRYDRDGDNKANDFVIIAPLDTTHIVLTLARADEFGSRNFRKGSGEFTEGVITATHELLHVFDFRTQCGGRGWDQSDAEENFMFRMEDLVGGISGNASAVLLNAIVNQILSTWSNTQNCLERLNLTRPQPSILTINSASPGSVSLSWTANENNDFSAYKLFRSTEANVTLNDTLVAEFNDRNSLAFIDDDFPGGQTFYYKLFTFDAPGLSAESNEIATVCAYTAEYFGNKDLAGPPLVTHCEPAPISYDWGTASPVPGIIPEDNFSVRWTGSFDFEDATYQFLALNDDGVRIYVDGVPIIDAWLDQASGFYFQNVPMTAGMHTVVVEHYEHFVDAHITARFIKL